MPARQRTVVEHLTVGADRNSVGTYRESLWRLSRNSQLQDFSFDHWNKCGVWLCRRMVVETAPTFSRSKIDHDDSIRARRTGVGNERHTLDPAMQIETD